MGSTCRNSGECSSGLTCEDNFCVVGERSSGGGGGGSSSPSDGGDHPPMFAIQVGGTLGLGLATSGQQADRFGNSAALVPSGVEDCAVPDGYYCVRVATSGLVAQGGVRVQAQLYFLDFLGVGVWARFAPAGEGDFAFFHLGARVNLVVVDTPLGAGGYDGMALHVDAFVGGGFGQIQVQPPDNLQVPGEAGTPESLDSPWVVSGLGNISLGAAGTLRFTRNIGLFLQADFMFQIPTFLFNIDLTLGAAVSF